MNKPRRLILFSLILVLFAAVCRAGANTHVTELQFSDMFPEDHPFGRLHAEWAAAVALRTEGAVRVVVHPGGALTSPDECFEGILQRASDICHSALAYTPGRFPVMEVADFPGFPPEGNTARLASFVANELYRAHKPAEFDGMHVLYLHAHPPGAFMSVDRPLTRLADFAGLKVRSTGLSARIAELLGAEPLLRPATQSYHLLALGEADATMAPLESLKHLGFGEVTKYTALASELGYVTTFALAINEDVWRKLSAETRRVITEVSEEFRERAAALWDEISLEGFWYALDHGHRFVALPKDEVAAKAEEVVAQLEREYLMRLEALGLEGSSALRMRRELIAAHAGAFPPIDLGDVAMSK